MLLFTFAYDAIFIDVNKCLLVVYTLVDSYSRSFAAELSAHRN